MTSARGRVADGLALLLVLAVGVILLGPILLLALFSFNDSSVIALPFEGFTLEWYREALADPAAITALGNSVVLASIVAPICVVLGTATAWAITRFRFRSAGAFGPGWWPFHSSCRGSSSVLQVCFCSPAWRSSCHLKTVGVMHIMTTFPLVTALVAARLVRFERSQEEAALDLGASQFQMMTQSRAAAARAGAGGVAHLRVRVVVQQLRDQLLHRRLRPDLPGVGLRRAPTTPTTFRSSTRCLPSSPSSRSSWSICSGGASVGCRRRRGGG